MRVLQVIPSYLPAKRYGGVVIATHALCAALAKAGCEVTVFTTNVDGPGDANVPIEQQVQLDGVSVWYFRSAWPRRLCYAPTMQQALERRCEEFDLLHLHSVYLWPTWAAARAARRYAVPYVVSPRGMLVDALIRRRSAMAKRLWIALIERRTLQDAAAVHVTSALEARELRQLDFALPRVFEVPNGVGGEDDGGGAAALPSALAQLLGGRRPVVLYVGRINWKKGIDRLISAAARLHDAVLLIVGNDEEGATSALQALAAREGVSDRVVFAGPVYGSAKAELYRHATVCALASRSENFGNVVLEAMREGCPVVVTPEVGAATIVGEARAGRVVSSEPEALAAAIDGLVRDDALRADMGRRGREAAVRQYAWPVIAKRMLEVYAACAGGPGRGGT